MWMKNSSDTIGNRTRDLAACSAVTQPTAPTRAPVWWHHVCRPMTPHVLSDDTTCAVRWHHMSRLMTLRVPSDDTTCPLWWHHVCRPMTPHVLSDDKCPGTWPRNNPDSAPSRPTSSCLLVLSDAEVQGGPALVVTLLCAALFSLTQAGGSSMQWTACDRPVFSL